MRKGWLWKHHFVTHFVEATDQGLCLLNHSSFHSPLDHSLDVLFFVLFCHRCICPSRFQLSFSHLQNKDKQWCSNVQIMLCFKHEIIQATVQETTGWRDNQSIGIGRLLFGNCQLEGISTCLLGNKCYPSPSVSKSVYSEMPTAKESIIKWILPIHYLKQDLYSNLAQITNSHCGIQSFVSAIQTWEEFVL